MPAKKTNFEITRMTNNAMLDNIAALSSDARVWIYQSNRFFTPEETEQINHQIADFTTTWTAHSHALRAAGKVFWRLFIVLMVDESQAAASGCSIDKSVHFIKSIEQQYQVSLFDRFRVAYLIDHHLNHADQKGFIEAYQQQHINDFTNVFNNLVTTKAQFDSQWIVPLEQSWQRRLVL